MYASVLDVSICPLLHFLLPISVREFETAGSHNSIMGPMRILHACMLDLNLHEFLNFS